MKSQFFFSIKLTTDYLSLTLYEVIIIKSVKLEPLCSGKQKFAVIYGMLQIAKRY